jgi:hypothetical protein
LFANCGSGTSVVLGTVQVTSADIVSDQIVVTLSSNGAGNATLTVKAVGGSVNWQVFSGTKTDGTYTFSFNPPNMPVGQYTTVTASWAVTSPPPGGSKSANFYVLGMYRHSQYNTPTESSCVGNPANAQWDNPPASCVYTLIQFRSDFIPQAWLNGSGITISNGPIQLPWGCPTPFPTNSFKPVSQITGSCGTVSNNTVAAGAGAPVTCGDQILILGLGAGGGTLKTVTDNCPRCVGHAQLDNYTTQPACIAGSISDLGNFNTIRVNR